MAKPICHLRSHLLQGKFLEVKSKPKIPQTMETNAPSLNLLLSTIHVPSSLLTSIFISLYIYPYTSDLDTHRHTYEHLIHSLIKPTSTTKTSLPFLFNNGDVISTKHHLPLHNPQHHIHAKEVHAQGTFINSEITC